jgi:hypothetical protein
VSITFSRRVRFYVFKQAMSTRRLLPPSTFQPWKKTGSCQVFSEGNIFPGNFFPVGAKRAACSHPLPSGFGRKPAAVKYFQRGYFSGNFFPVGAKRAACSHPLPSSLGGNERLLNEIYKQNWILRQPIPHTHLGLWGNFFIPRRIKISLI